VIHASAVGVVPARPADVYALLLDPGRMAALGGHRVEILAVEEQGGRRVIRTRTRTAGGAVIESQNTVIERVADRRVVVEGEIRPFGLAPTRRGRFGRALARVERTLEPHPDGTSVAVRMEVRVRPLPLRVWFTVFKRGQWRRGVAADLDRLRAAFS
jgi:Polyketide cyclase / dehydrase and lipid transport